MPNFQQSVNQTIGTVGVLAGLSPTLRQKKLDRAESDKLTRQSEVADRAITQASKGIDLDEPMIAENDAYIDALQNKENIAKRLFDLNPTDESYGKYNEAFTKRQMASLDLQDAREKWKKDTDDLIKKQEQAMADMESKKEAKKTLRRNFTTYLAQQPTSFGGTVGDLSSDLQKKIAAQYDRNARRRMMNQMDREARDGKQ